MPRESASTISSQFARASSASFNRRLESFFDKYMVASSHRRKAEFSASNGAWNKVRRSHAGRLRSGQVSDQSPTPRCQKVRGEAAKRAGLPLCRSCNEKMWSDGRPVHPSRAIGQANKGGYAWLEIANPVETVGAS